MRFSTPVLSPGSIRLGILVPSGPAASGRVKTRPMLICMSRAPRPFAVLLGLSLAAVASVSVAQPRAEAPAQDAHARPVSATPAGNGIVAVVNGDIVTRGDITNRARLFALNVGLAANQDAVERLRPQVTRLMVDEKLRAQEVQRRRILVTDDEVLEAIRDIEKRNNMPAGALQQQLRAAGVQSRVLQDQFRTQIGWARLIRAVLGPSVEPSEEQIDDFRRANEARTGEPEYLASEIFVPVDNPAQETETKRFVEEVVRQLRGGTPFQVAATQFSQSQTAVQGGDLGWIHKDQVDPEVAAVLQRMPVGAVSNALRVAGGFQIVTLRARRETGRDLATMLGIRQVFFPFTSQLNPEAPTDQQRQQLERAQRLTSERGCEAVERAARTQGGDRPADPGPVRLETINPPPLRQLLAALTPGGPPSRPIIAPDGILVIAVCSKETRNLAQISTDDIKNQLLRDRIETVSRQLQRDLRRRANIELRG